MALSRDSPNFRVPLISQERWGSLQRSPRSPSWWGGGLLPLLKNPTPDLGPSGLELRPFWPSVPIVLFYETTTGGVPDLINRANIFENRLKVSVLADPKYGISH